LTQECPFFHAENLAEQLKTVTKAREELSLALALEKGRRQELDQWRQQAEERRRQDLEQWRQETEARSKSLSQAVKVCLALPSSVTELKISYDAQCAYCLVSGVRITDPNGALVHFIFCENSLGKMKL
jgi:hypothetical protein